MGKRSAMARSSVSANIWAYVSRGWLMPAIQTGDITGLLIVVLAISVIPFIAMVVTSYMKIVVVLGLLRNALGVQQVPPNMVLNGIAIIVSVYIMAPVAMDSFDTIKTQGVAGSTAAQVEQVV